MKTKDIIGGLEKKRSFPNFRVGDTVNVHVKIHEGEKERVQVYKGVVIKRRRGDEGASFTVRKVSYGIGVERVFPFQSPAIEKIEVVQHGKVRRGRLYFLRELRGRDAVVDKGSRDESMEYQEPVEEETPTEAAQDESKADDGEKSSESVSGTPSSQTTQDRPVA